MRRLALVLGLLGFASASAASRAGVATWVRSAPVIDGKLEEWNPGLYGVTPVIELTQGTSMVEQGRIDSDRDQSGDVYVTYDAQNLYVAAQVSDDSVEATHRQGEMWKGDMFEVLIARPDGEYLHVGVNPAGDAFVFHPLDAAHEAARLKIESAARAGAPGYSLELKIPRAALGVSARESRLRFNFGAWDSDPSETPTAHRTWSGYRHNLLASFGTLVLDPTPRSPPTTKLDCPAPASTVTLDAPLRARGTELLGAKDRVVKLRLLNFQSSVPNWDDFWIQWDLTRVRRDLDRAKALGTNAIRIFIFFGPFGGRQPSAEMVSRATALIDEAARRGIVSVVSFFPFDKDFRKERYPEMAEHLAAIVARFQGDPAIAMWDLMNEPDHMWMKPESGVKPADVAAWAEHMAAVVRKADPTHLVTVGLAGHYAVGSGPVRAEEALLWVDVQSIHWYFGVERLAAGLERAKGAMTKPLVLQEFGVSGQLYDEAAAADQYRRACDAADHANLAGFGAWELYDHPVGSIGFSDPPYRENAENYFGLLRIDGTPKKQAGVFCRCLSVPQLHIPREEKSVRPSIGGHR